MVVFLLAGLLAVAQSSAQASDAQCVLDQISAADRTALGLSARRGDESMGAPAERLQEAMVRCATRLHWSPEQGGTASAMSFSIILRDEAGPQLGAAGIPAARIEAWLAGQSDAVRTDPEIAQATIDALVQHLHETGLAMPLLEANGELIGMYLGAQVVMERLERGLPM